MVQGRRGLNLQIARAGHRRPCGSRWRAAVGLFARAAAACLQGRVSMRPRPPASGAPAPWPSPSHRPCSSPKCPSRPARCRWAPPGAAGRNTWWDRPEHIAGRPTAGGAAAPAQAKAARRLACSREQRRRCGARREWRTMGRRALKGAKTSSPSKAPTRQVDDCVRLPQ